MAERIFDGKFLKIDRADNGYEIVRVSNAVAILVYHPLRGILLVSQDRASMIDLTTPEGTILEVVAGRLDKPLTLGEIILDELECEAGITANEKDIVFVQEGALATSPGISTERMYLAYVAINDDNLIGNDGDTFGDAKEGERIKRRWVSVSEAINMQWQDLKSWALFRWFLNSQQTIVSDEPTGMFCSDCD